MKKLLILLLISLSTSLIHPMGIEKHIVAADKAIQSYQGSDFSIAYRMDSTTSHTVQPHIFVAVSKILAKLDYRSQLPLIEYLTIQTNRLESVYFNESLQRYNGGAYSITEQTDGFMNIKLVEEDSERVDYEAQFKQAEANYQSK
jgi:hypothetical protein